MASKRAVRRGLERRGCKGKVRHASYGFALIAKSKTAGGDDASLNVYHCRFCGGFHIGHRPQRPYPIATQPSRLRVKPIDWWGEWKDQRREISEYAEVAAMEALSRLWMDEDGIGRLYREYLEML